MDMEQMMRIGKVATEYYKQIPFKPTQKDFESWIESMNEPMKSHFKKDGLTKCRGVLNFKRFWLEMRDYVAAGND